MTKCKQCSQFIKEENRLWDQIKELGMKSDSLEAKLFEVQKDLEECRSARAAMNAHDKSRANLILENTYLKDTLQEIVDMGPPFEFAVEIAREALEKK